MDRDSFSCHFSSAMGVKGYIFEAVGAMSACALIARISLEQMRYVVDLNGDDRTCLENLLSLSSILKY